MATLILGILNIRTRNTFNLEVRSLHNILLFKIPKLPLPDMNVDSGSDFPHCHRYLSTVGWFDPGPKKGSHIGLLAMFLSSRCCPSLLPHAIYFLKTWGHLSCRNSNILGVADCLLRLFNLATFNIYVFKLEVRSWLESGSICVCVFVVFFVRILNSLCTGHFIMWCVRKSLLSGFHFSNITVD